MYVDEALDLIAVPVVPGAVFRVGNPRRLFSLQPFLVVGYPFFEVSPDRKHLIITRAVGALAKRQNELIVVQTFSQELSAKMPVKE